MIDLKKECAGASTIAVGGHIHPDGDCVGSTLAVTLYLRKIFPEKRVDLFLEPIPEIFCFLKGTETIINDFSTDVSSYDLFIAIDCSYDRLGDSREIYKAAAKTLNIDHHVSNPMESDVMYLEAEASSSCELVFNLIDRDIMDEDMAKAIFIGIVHDTGVFQYSSTAPSTFMAAAHLISYGFDFSKMIDKTYYEKTYTQNKVLGRALLDSRLHLDGRVISTILDCDTLAEYGADSGDTEGIASHIRSTKGVECSVFIYQLKDRSFKVSLRAASDSSIDVSKVAAVFGGGGHVKAAGCTFRKDPEEILADLLKELEKQL